MSEERTTYQQAERTASAHPSTADSSDCISPHARGGGGIQENNVGNELLKTIMKKTIFYLKNLFDSEIMPIFAARMRVAYRRDDIKLRNRSLYIKPQVEYLWL